MQPGSKHRPKNSLVWKIFFLYLILSITLLVGINFVIIFNETDFFAVNSQFISIAITSAIFMVCSLVFLIILRSILRPLKELISNIQSFLEGNWEQRSYIEANDESGLLAEDFNTLTEEIIALYMANESTQIKQQLVSDPITNFPEFHHKQAVNYINDLTRLFSTLQEAEDPGHSDQILNDIIKTTFGEVQITYAELDIQTDTPVVLYKNHSEMRDIVLIRSIIESSEIIHLNNHPVNVFDDSNEISTPTLTRSVIGIPIVRDHETTGALLVERNTPNEKFTDDEMQGLNALSSFLPLFTRTKSYISKNNQYLENQEILIDLTRKMVATTDISSVLQIVVQELHRTLNANMAKISLKPLPGDEQISVLPAQKQLGGNGFEH